MIRKYRYIQAVAAVGVAVALTACSAPSSGHNNAAPKQQGRTTSGGMPANIQPLQARQIVADALKGKRVAFVKQLTARITDAWSIQMQRTFDSFGVEYKVYDSNFDVDQMIRTVDDLIRGHKADVLVLHNPDLGTLAAQIQAAADAGIYTVVPNMMSSHLGDAYVGADVIGGSLALTDRALADCKTSGRKQVAIIDGTGADSYSIQMAEGVKRAIKDTGFEVVETLHSGWQTDQMSQHASTLVQRHAKTLCAIITGFDVGAISIGKSVNDAEKQDLIKDGDVGVYSLDATEEGCQGLENGSITALLSVDQAGLGTALGVIVQNLLVSGKPAGSEHLFAYVPHVVVDKKNASGIHQACFSGT